MTELEKAEQGLPFILNGKMYKIDPSTGCDFCAFKAGSHRGCLRMEKGIGHYCLAHVGAWVRASTEDNI